MRSLPSSCCLFGSVRLGSSYFACRSDQRKYLSFQLENHYLQPATRFAEGADFGGNALSCSLVVQVKQPADLHPGGTCGLPVDVSSGRVTEKNWEARIIYVEFANGMRWTPAGQSTAN